jgi:hypothetical protein
MALDPTYRLPDNLSDEIGMLLREMRALPTWTARKYEVFAQFECLARKKGYLHFTADARDYRLSGSGNSCLYQVPLNQRGALSAFAGKFIRVVCGGKSNRYSGRHYHATPVSRRWWRLVDRQPDSARHNFGAE